MKEIITKYFEGVASKAEQTQLLEWLRDKKNRLIFDGLKLDWEKNSKNRNLPKGSENIWLAIQDQMLQKSYHRWQQSRRTNMFFRIAAVFFFVISLGIASIFFLEKEDPRAELYTNIVAEKGQISKVVLPDGSEVWLNSGSEIIYNNLFAEDNRNLELTGEAYFQVKRNPELPLVVSNGEVQVKVLGTKFNVAAYPESDKIQIVLEAGKVDLLAAKDASSLYSMKPGELASYDKTKRNITVSNVNTIKFTSWKDGIINIYNQTLEELVERLEKRYNQQFDYDEEIKNYHFTFTIKNEPLDQIIKLMEQIAPITVEQKADVVVFKRDKMKERELSR